MFIQKIRGLERKVEEPLSLMDAGITEEQIDKSMVALVSLTIKDANMYTKPLASAAPILLDTFLKTCGQTNRSDLLRQVKSP